MFRYSYGLLDDPNILPAGQPINTDHHFFPNGDFTCPAFTNDYLMQQNRSIPDAIPVNPFYYSSEFLDFHHTDTLGRVYSTYDLPEMNSTTQEGIAAAVTAGHVGRYTTEERKERINRYRSKRNQRNFHKKITYACRKTLADSRPRVRGRFTRNREIENEEQESSEISFECYSYSTCDNGGSHSNSGISATNGEGGMQAALTIMDEEECCYDEDIWTSLDTVFNL